MDNIDIQRDGLRFKSLADISPAGIFLTDCSGSCTYVNQSWMALSGLSASEAHEYGWADALHPDDREHVLAEWHRAVQNDQVFNLEFRVQKPNGESVWISALSSPYGDEDDTRLGFVGLCFDVSRQKAMQIEIDNANRLFRKAEQIAQIGTWRLDVHSYQLFWSEQVFAIHDLPEGPVPSLGKVLEFYPGHEKSRLSETIRQSIESQTAFDLETGFVTANNQQKRVRNIGEPQFENGKLTSIIGVCQDVTDKFQLEEKLRLAAQLDDLTGIANRKMFVETIYRMTNQKDRSKDGDGGIVLMLIDLDDFKRVNDDLGHPAGDELLIQVADRLSAVAGTELVARIGGDEFAVVKRVEGDTLNCDKTVQEIQSCFTRAFTIGSRQLKCSASIGWTAGEAGKKSEEILSKEADIALYCSKKTHPKVPVMFNHDIGLRHKRYTKLAGDLKSALANGEMYLLFQPQLNIESNQIKSFEALLRWDHPDLGEVSPAELIPIAEETGTIGSLGDWVVAEACRHAALWPDEINVSVNVSATQLIDPDFISKIMRTIAKYQMDPNRLELEITESVFIENIDQTKAMLEKLSSIGVRIALDDFGTGFSSLSYLCAIPFDTVKIDRSFVAQIGELEGAAPIISAVTGLGAALNFQTVAEGVENSSQLAFLKEKGCNHIQGFLISEPISSRDVQEFFGLKKYQVSNG
jgi:diguanylate cyclase (GGDEF)-like protein/PAS domain S-box-containing protein